MLRGEKTQFQVLSLFQAESADDGVIACGLIEKAFAMENPCVIPFSFFCFVFLILFPTERYAAIFTDMYMPSGILSKSKKFVTYCSLQGILGSELAVLVRMKEKRFGVGPCKIFAMSASSDNETLRMGKEHCINAFLKKPIQMKDIGKLLEKCK